MDADPFEREERCRKSLRTVSKAILMRLLVSGLLIFAMAGIPGDLWGIGLMILVLVINLTGLFPLVSEWKKQRRILKAILAEETE